MKLNQYEWDPQTDKIGAGAFAEVFKAKDQRGDPVALKVYTEAVIKSSTSGSFKGKYTLESEFSKGRDLSHTNIVRYIGLDYIVHTDIMQRELSYPVLIMEYADGGSLEGWLQSSFPPDADEALKVITGIFKGLDYLHDQGIIHRDLKPANILFKSDRKRSKVVKIADFGISRDVLEENVNTLSSTTGVGTTSYMAPEQFLNKTFGLNGTISNRTDIWAAGVIFYRMLTGNFPFGGRGHQSYEALLEEITQTEPDYTQIPAKFLPVIKGCLQKKAADRYPDLNAALKALETISLATQPDDDKGTTVVPKEATPIFSRPNPVRPPAPPPPTPTNYKTIAITAAAVIVAAMAFYFIFRRHTSNHPAIYGSDSTKMDIAKMDSAKMTDTAKKMIDTSRKITSFRKPAEKDEKRTFENVKKQGEDTASKSNGAVNMGADKSFSFFDGFSDNSNSWPLNNESLAPTKSVISITDEKLIIQGKSDAFSYPCTKAFDLNSDKAFDVTVTAQWTNGATDEDFGIEYASNLSSGPISIYRFGITSNGYYTIYYKENDVDWKYTQKYTKSSFINQNHGINILEVQRHGFFIDFFINNIKVYVIFFKGSSGKYFGVYSDETQTDAFDDFTLNGSK